MLAKRFCCKVKIVKCVAHLHARLHIDFIVFIIYYHENAGGKTLIELWLWYDVDEKSMLFLQIGTATAAVAVVDGSSRQTTDKTDIAPPVI